MKINNLDNPLFIFLLFLLSIFVNTISSIYFFPILFLGILFIAFSVCLKKRYYYSLTFIVLAFLFIELNSGFKAFSITLIAILIYTFISPKIKRILSFSTLNPYIYITIFYLAIFILWSLQYEVSSQLYYTMLINIVIDFILFGILI